MPDTRLMVMCHDRVLEDCSHCLTLSNLEVYSWKFRKKAQVLGAKGVHLVVQIDQAPGSEHEEGAMVCIRFAVPRQVARKQAGEPVGKGTTEGICSYPS